MLAQTIFSALATTAEEDGNTGAIIARAERRLARKLVYVTYDGRNCSQNILVAILIRRIRTGNVSGDISEGSPQVMTIKREAGSSSASHPHSAERATDQLSECLLCKKERLKSVVEARKRSHSLF